MAINPKSIQAYKLMHDGTLALARAERQGIRVDVNYAESKKLHLTRKIDRLQTKLEQTKFYRHWTHHSKSKPNINSNLQLAHFLYNVKNLEPAKLTESGKGSTDDESLKLLNIPELNIILEIKKLRKVRDTYLSAFIREQVNGYIHTSFNLHLVKSYRSSSDRPNFQNIPRRDEEAMQTCRKALYPRPGHQLLEVDYSGLEVRIAACYHQDPNMLKYINNPASDMHGDMAKQIFKLPKLDKSISEHKVLRDAAKNGFVFPEFYGDYYKNCAESMACNWGELPQSRWKEGQGIKMPEGYLSDHLIAKGIKSYKQFESHIQDIETDFWENRFPDYARWKKRWWAMYQKYGYIDMKTGFRCIDLLSRNDAINRPVQGAAFHCLLWSFIEIDRIMIEERWDSKLIGQIHDSVVLDVNPSELHHVAKTVRRVTCEDLPKAWKWIITPLSVDMELAPVDGSWADKEEFLC
ncbi:MAG TPA: hypothetical protein ENH82_03335 [bacterium]|nr:hypothetical protein [bacterium]